VLLLIAVAESDHMTLVRSLMPYSAGQ